MWTSCGYHVTIMWLSCEHHVAIMWTSCGYHVTIMWLSCEHHVTIMWLSCEHHVTIMWTSCDYHVNMWLSCDYHVTIMEHHVAILWTSCDYYMLFCDCHVIDNVAVRRKSVLAKTARLTRPKWRAMTAPVQPYRMDSQSECVGTATTSNMERSGTHDTSFRASTPLASNVPRLILLGAFASSFPMFVPSFFDCILFFMQSRKVISLGKSPKVLLHTSPPHCSWSSLSLDLGQPRQVHHHARGCLQVRHTHTHLFSISN